MRLKLIPQLVFAASLVAAVWPAQGQVAPSATHGDIPVLVGGGFSDYLLDWGPGVRMQGISAWVDFYPRRLPRVVYGLGLEAEGRDVNFGRPSYLTKMRQDTILGGPIYDWSRYDKFHPYAKLLAGLGSIDFPGTTYTHDTFLVAAPGGGAEYRCWRNVWVRADYEYQFWPGFFGQGLNPQGFTVGASYDFRHREEE